MSWQQDIRFSLRLLARHKSLSAIMIITLAIGIGATTSVFSVVNRVLLRPLPYPEPERLVLAWAAGAVPKGVFLLAQQKHLQTMESIAAFSPSGFNLTNEGEAERLDGSLVSANFFSVLGGPHAQMGRIFQTGEDRIGQDRVVVISYQLWQRRFRGGCAAFSGGAFGPILLRSPATVGGSAAREHFLSHSGGKRLFV